MFFSKFSGSLCQGFGPGARERIVGALQAGGPVGHPVAPPVVKVVGERTWKPFAAFNLFEAVEPGVMLVVPIGFGQDGGKLVSSPAEVPPGVGGCGAARLGGGAVASG